MIDGFYYLAREGAAIRKFRDSKGRFVLLACALLMALVAPARAQALELRVRNDFANSLNTAVVYFDDSSGAWRTKGWYVVGPKSSKTFTFSTSRQEIYLHSLLAGPNRRLWGRGDVTRMVISKSFSYLDGEDCPAGPERRRVKFSKYTAKQNVLNYRPVKAVAPLPDAGGNSFTADQTELLKLINAERRKAGVGDVVLNATVSDAAKRRVLELPKRMEHTRPNGKKYNTVFAEFNLKPAASAENLARTTGPLKVSRVNELFMNSSSHRKNMLNPEYTTIGIAFYSAGGHNYCVELFTGPGERKETGSDRLAVVSANIVSLVNNERKRSGLKPLATSGALHGAALTRAGELVRKADINTRPDGRKFDTVLSDNGLVYAYSWSSGSVFDSDNPLEMYRKFSSDAVYRKQILTKEISAIGVGIFQHGSTYVCAQLLCASEAPVKSLEESWKELEESIQDLRDLFK
jgi:uncharacterized protein YkwD